MTQHDKDKLLEEEEGSTSFTTSRLDIHVDLDEDPGPEHVSNTVEKEVTPRLSEEIDVRSGCQCWPVWLCKEIKEVFHLSWTMALVFLFNNLQQPISLLFAGHLGTKELGGVALAGTFIKVSGTTVGAGLATACDTVFSQTFGSGNKKYVGVHLQRSLMVNGLFILPCWAILLNTESLLMLSGQDPEVARIAGQFTLIVMPALLFLFAYTVLSRYIRNQGILLPFLGIGSAGVISNVVFQYLFVTVLDMGTDGSAIGRLVSSFALSAATVGYIFGSKMYRDTWGGFSAESFQGWGTFLSIAIYGLLNNVFLWLGFEMGTIMAGTLSAVQLGAQSILFQIETLTFCFATGTGAGCNIRIGHLLGANKPSEARQAVFGGYALIGFISATIITLLLILKDYIPMVFTADPDVIEIAAQTIPILAIYNFFDMTAAVSSGILKGCGRQRVSAFIIFVALYFIGLPIGISLMLLTDLGIAGFWYGMSVGLFIESAWNFLAVFKTDWKKEAADAQVRAGLKRQQRMTAEKDTAEESTPLLTKKGQEGSKDYSGGTKAKRNFMPGTLSTPVLIFRRSLFALGAVLVLGAGIFCRFTFDFSLTTTNSTQLCIPRNNTSSINDTWVVVGNVTFPVCPS